MKITKQIEMNYGSSLFIIMNASEEDSEGYIPTKQESYYIKQFNQFLTIDKILDFLKISFGLSRLQDVANIMGINQTTIPYWRQHNNLEKAFFTVASLGLGVELAIYLYETWAEESSERFNMFNFVKDAYEGYLKQIELKRKSENKRMMFALYRNHITATHTFRANILTYTELNKAMRVADSLYMYLGKERLEKFLESIDKLSKEQELEVQTEYVKKISSYILEGANPQEAIMEEAKEAAKFSEEISKYNFDRAIYKSTYTPPFPYNKQEYNDG